MGMSSPTRHEPNNGGNAYHLALFAAISVLCGLLVAGLLLPFAAMFGQGVKAGANSLESLPAQLDIGQQSERSKVLMADGETLAEFYSENRVYVTLKNIAPVMRTAQVAIEDSRFYEHGAIDFRGTARALVRSASGTTQGGSTLTQQYVKQVQIEAAMAAADPSAAEKAREQTLARKIKELRYAVAVEKKLTKDQILERYLNIAYYGDGAYGVEAAARHYFNSHANALTLPQAAMLAGLVQNPDATNPHYHPQSALNRRNVVLNRMVQLGKITQAQATAAKKATFDPSKIVTAKQGCIVSKFPTLCYYVYNSLLSDDFKVLGSTKAQRLNTLQRGGLTIQTLINPTAQQAAEDAVHSRVAATDPFISTSVLIQPKTGLIVSMAQNRNELGTGAGQTWYNYAVDQAHGGAEGYQAGSTFKAFTMAAAFAQGISTARSYDAAARMNFQGWTFDSCKGSFTQSSSFSVKNSTGYNGYMNMTKAAMWSVNTYFIQLERSAGLCNVVKTAQAAGVKLANGKDMINDAAPGNDAGKGYDWVPSFTLGTAEVTPLSMAEAYATFANGGVHCNPIIIKSLKTKAGKELTVPSANCQRVMDGHVAYEVSRVLQQVIENGTARPAHLSSSRDQAAKTGTIDGAGAVWLAGYTPDMAGIAMIAVDKMKGLSSLTGHYSHGTDCPYGCYLNGSGGQDAGKIWRASMNAALENIPASDFTDSDATVSNGNVEMPDLSGMTLTEAQAALKNAGFTNVVTVEEADDSRAGTFMHAIPRSGSYPKDTKIQLVVSSGR